MINGDSWACSSSCRWSSLVLPSLYSGVYGGGLELSPSAESSGSEAPPSSPDRLRVSAVVSSPPSRSPKEPVVKKKSHKLITSQVFSAMYDSVSEQLMSYHFSSQWTHHDSAGGFTSSQRGGQLFKNNQRPLKRKRSEQLLIHLTKITRHEWRIKPENILKIN